MGVHGCIPLTTSKEGRGGRRLFGDVGDGRQQRWLWVAACYCGGARKRVVRLRERERHELERGRGVRLRGIERE